jgi:hypothetical protein
VTNLIAFPKFQADLCRLHNRQPELEAQRRRLDFELEPEPVPRSFPTPFGWFLIGLAMISEGRRG